MSRGGALAAALSGCQTWLDRADATALETCAKFTDEAERAKCRETVVATERAKQQKLVDDMELRQQESEERERLNEVFGDPKKP